MYALRQLIVFLLVMAAMAVIGWGAYAAGLVGNSPSKTNCDNNGTTVICP